MKAFWRHGAALAVALVGGSARALAAGPDDVAEGAAPGSAAAEATAGEAEGADGDAPPDVTPEDPAVAQARDAFRLGSALARQGQWTEARAAFERSETLRPHSVTRYNIGYVERALGHLTRARKLLLDALGETGDSALPPELEREAEAYVAEIERKLARAAVTLEHGTAVAVDGRPLERADSPSARPLLVAGTAEPGPGKDPGVASFDLLVDPGSHVIVLSRPGVADTVLNERFEPGSTRALSLALGGPLAASPEPSRPADPVADRPTGEAPSPDRTWMWVSYGVGAAGIVTGSVFGILAIDKKAFLDDEKACSPDGVCPPGAQGDIDTMNLYALVSTIGFGVGVAGAAAGTYFLLSTGSDEGGADEVSARVYLGPGQAGVVGRF